ncbi:hypothetical protein [Dyadobacter sandarakinus]|uniref:Uncharacterized protein n=1 Tax=Dyadobacter sandarakinus TaxID=2747268 RepID=A0ABX7I4M9_9BACT|nr:hypothetical protein [Dyadobacter sandarakinus]QRR00818.1 hypothetical protein HWI92_07800 [Dyadobacter sandarakinus]
MKSIMPGSDYTILRENPSFNLDHYMPYIGWIGNPQPYKVYTLEGSNLFYLYDEAQDELFAFTTEKKGKEMRLEEVIQAYINQVYRE